MCFIAKYLKFRGTLRTNSGAEYMLSYNMSIIYEFVIRCVFGRQISKAPGLERIQGLNIFYYRIYLYLLFKKMSVWASNI